MATTTKRTRKNATPKSNLCLLDYKGDWLVGYRPNKYGFFSLEHNGAVIYGCILRAAKENGRLFVSYPSGKGTDGNYYSHAYFKDQPPAEMLDDLDNFLDTGDLGSFKELRTVK